MKKYDLEKELASFTPRGLSDEAAREISDVLSRPRSIVRLRPVHLIAAAAVLLLALTTLFLYRNSGEQTVVADTSTIEPSPHPNRPTLVLEPDYAASVLISRAPAGRVVVNGGVPARAVRYQYADHMNWRNPQRKVTFSAVRPREEVIYVPVEVY